MAATAGTSPGPRDPPASTTRSAAAVTRRTSRSAAECTGTSASPIRSAGPAASRACSSGRAACPALTRMTRLLYEKLVPADTLLAPLFANVPPGYPQREAARISAAFGGPPARGPGTGRPGQQLTRTRRLARGAGPAGAGFTEEQRTRWITLAGQAADEAGLPADAEFRAALEAFFAWDARARWPGAPEPRRTGPCRAGTGPRPGRRTPPRPCRAAVPPPPAPRRRCHALPSGAAGHPARAGRAGQLRRAYQADVPGRRTGSPCSSPSICGPMTTCGRTPLASWPARQRHDALRRGLAGRPDRGLPAVERNGHPA